MTLMSLAWMAFALGCLWCIAFVAYVAPDDNTVTGTIVIEEPKKKKGGRND